MKFIFEVTEIKSSTFTTEASHFKTLRIDELSREKCYDFFKRKIEEGQIKHLVSPDLERHKIFDTYTTKDLDNIAALIKHTNSFE